MYSVSRKETFAKLFITISFTGLIMYAVLAFYTVHIAYTNVSNVQKYQNSIRALPDMDVLSDSDQERVKYILMWTTKKQPYAIEEGVDLFLNNKCDFINCFITTNKTFLKGGYIHFDAIVFNMGVLKKWRNKQFPQSRAPKQKYVFYSMLSSEDYPVCDIHADNYFNWTWSYKLYSDIFNPFFNIMDLKGNVIAPNFNVQWTHNMSYLTDSDKEKLKTKKKAVAIIMEGMCLTRSNKISFSKELRKALKQHGLVFDIYGCGGKMCPNRTKEGCLKAIEQDYYFYLAYEDSFAEDYVTNEVLKAYNHNAVPIVVGGADYEKFLPDGSYLNVRESTADKIAAMINYIISNPRIYYNFFRWKKHYTFREIGRYKGVCELCKLLNDPIRFKSSSAYELFRIWWYYGSLQDRCIPKGAQKYKEVLPTTKRKKLEYETKMNQKVVNI